MISASSSGATLDVDYNDEQLHSIRLTMNRVSIGEDLISTEETVQKKRTLSDFKISMYRLSGIHPDRSTGSPVKSNITDKNSRNSPHELVTIESEPALQLEVILADGYSSLALPDSGVTADFIDEELIRRL